MMRVLRDIGWGFFCASSWTWCIGTFLPFLMLRLHGWPGFWLFLIPNVVGCTLFGWWFTPESSRRFCAKHQRLMALFSAVTISYQVAFLWWMIPATHAVIDDGTGVTSGQWALAITLGAGTAIALIAGWRNDDAWMDVASIAAIGPIVVLLQSPVTPIDQWPGHGAMAQRDLWLAAPLVVSGFLACPFLDLTFHRARQSASGPCAFAVFGAVFGLMIVAVAMQWDGTGAALAFPMVLTWCVQLPFTALAHTRELAGSLRSGSLIVHTAAGRVQSVARLNDAPFVARALVLVGAIAAVGWLMAATLPESALAWWLPGETSYVRWLAMYGVVFPVLLLAAWARWRVARTVAALAVAMGGAELGFLHASSWWLLWPAAVMAVVMWDAAPRTLWRAA